MLRSASDHHQISPCDANTYKTHWRRELKTWSQKINRVDSPYYFYRKCAGTKIENLHFYFRVFKGLTLLMQDKVFFCSHCLIRIVSISKRAKKNSHVSSVHIGGFSSLYPLLRTWKSLWLAMVGYGVPPTNKATHSICTPYKQEENWSRNVPAINSGIVPGDALVCYWPFFTMWLLTFTTNRPRSICERFLGPVSYSFLKW